MGPYQKMVDPRFYKVQIKSGKSAVQISSFGSQKQIIFLTKSQRLGYLGKELGGTRERIGKV